jgi:hypothetical protein
LVGLGLFGRRRGFLGLKLFSWNFLEHWILDHLLVEKVRQFKRRHRQQLDRLLQRGRQDQFLDELRVEFLLDTH